MTPVRLVILAILFYIVWKLLSGIGNKKKSNPDTKPPDDGPVQDVLVEDPVCHTLIPKKQAIRLRQNGTTHYFCSDACCDKYTDKAEAKK